MGEVYRARDKRLARDVAIKILPEEVAADPARRARFDQEARACGALNHPNIVAVYDTGQEGDVTYIVTELVEGESLRAFVGRDSLAGRKLAVMGAQIAQGLAAAHGAHVTHRDLKPENIMVARDGRVKILDFGLAKRSGQPPQDATVTQGLVATDPGAVVGTVAYMSPEQARGLDVDPRSDIFSLGVILYELAGGTRPFTGPSAADIMSGILRAEPPPLQGVPDSLARIVYRCLEKEPAARFQSAADLAFALESTSGGSTATGQIAAAGQAPSRVTRRTALWTGGVVAAGAAGFAGGRLWRRDTTSQLSFWSIPTVGDRIVSAVVHPDGKSVIYHARVDGKTAAFYQTLNGNAPRRLALPDGSNVESISSRGELAFLLGNTLYRTPMDPIAPRALLDDVLDANWSGDGESLQVVRHVGKKYRLDFPIGKTLFEHDRAMLDPCLSPRSDRSAFAILAPAPRVQAVDRAGRVEVLFEGTGSSISTSGTFWSPDDKEVWGIPLDGKDPYALAAFSHGRQRLIARLPGVPQLCGISRDGGLLMILGWSDGSVSVSPRGASNELPVNLDAQPQAFSADGRFLILRIVRAPRTQSDIYLQELDGSPPILLGKGGLERDLWMAITPDGQWVQVARESGHVLIPTGAGQEREVKFAGLIGPTIIASIGPKWLVRAVEEGRSRGIHAYFMADPNTGQLEKLKLEDSVERSVVLASPDGTRLLLRDYMGKWSLARLDGEGSATAIPLARPDAVYGWTADGRGLYVGRQAGPQLTVERYDLDSGKREPWKTFNSGRPDVALGSLCVTPDGGAWAYTRSRSMDRLILARGLEG
jgi:hypothetical protein